MTGAVFIDLRKAFDGVNHPLLLKKLYALGIVDQEYEWFATILKVELRFLVSKELSQTLNLFMLMCPKDRFSDLYYLCFL